MPTTLAKTDVYAEVVLRNGLMGAAGQTRTTTMYVALYPADPGRKMTASTELSVSGYARQPVNFLYRMNATSQLPSVYTDNPILWPVAVSAWGTVGGLAIFATETGGTALYRGAFEIPQTVAAGNQFAIGAGDFEISEG